MKKAPNVLLTKNCYSLISFLNLEHTPFIVRLSSIELSNFSFILFGVITISLNDTFRRHESSYYFLTIAVIALQLILGAQQY